MEEKLVLSLAGGCVVAATLEDDILELQMDDGRVVIVHADEHGGLAFREE